MYQLHDWVTNNGRRLMALPQVADFLVADTYFDVALESTRDLLLAMQVRTVPESLAASLLKIATLCFSPTIILLLF